MQALFIQPVLQEKIWGGSQLHDQFGLDIPSDHTGEAWVISAHPNGDSTVTSPANFQGMTLSQVYYDYPDLFGPDHPDTFPLLIKILDAKENLSVQVHPDDTYGMEHAGELGKTECWYILSAQEGAQIVYGHTAQSREEFQTLIDQGAWDQLLCHVPVKAGDFFSVPAGTIHAIGAGITLLETQQNSDTTYRVYDYDRKDGQGKTRDLHIQESLDVARIPHYQDPMDKEEIRYGHSSVTRLLSNVLFTVYHWQVEEALTLTLDPIYYLATVIKGEGRLHLDGTNYSLSPAQSFILPYGHKNIELSGDLELIVSHPN